ncbi:pentapeptide repeat-containing protein [Actinomadura sp. NPDC023710]|uniref:pentapeptide repeat-containing protein n=1 Tax=Actinomadura sp. NPDC023710 TaxID=3158219 RepID=UPI0033C73FCD
MSDNIEPAGRDKRHVKDAHRTLGLWSIRRALTVAFTTAVILLVAAWSFIFWLLGSPSKATPQPLDAKTQLELLKLGFALVAGVGALVALVTAYRRQRVDEAAAERAERAQAHAEQVARVNAFDATERRVTELFGQAVEQLGHEKAAVRLGGLYSLERLAQGHEQHRQTVTDVVCAYLRMPFHHLQLDASETVLVEIARQELQVRLAAQRMLHRHLTAFPSDEEQSERYWDGILIDLAGARLIEFDFTRCRPVRANFSEALFTGTARFDEAKFVEEAGFGGARFKGNVKFSKTQFGGTASFDAAKFDDEVGFDRAQFDGSAWFDEACFGKDAWFGSAQFNGPTWFEDNQFYAGAWFDEVVFNETIRFRGARFNGDAGFRGSQFNGTAEFNEAQFHNEPDFEGATARLLNANHVWPSSWRAQAQSTGAEVAQLIRVSRERR